MIKNIIFDFDGVLVDSEILVAKAFAKYMKNFGIQWMSFGCIKMDEKSCLKFHVFKTSFGCD